MPRLGITLAAHARKRKQHEGGKNAGRARKSAPRRACLVTQCRPPPWPQRNRPAVMPYALSTVGHRRATYVR
jgi:hypothetical protein